MSWNWLSISVWYIFPNNLTAVFGKFCKDGKKKKKGSWTISVLQCSLFFSCNNKIQKINNFLYIFSQAATNHVPSEKRCFKTIQTWQQGLQKWISQMCLLQLPSLGRLTFPVFSVLRDLFIANVTFKTGMHMCLDKHCQKADNHMLSVFLVPVKLLRAQGTTQGFSVTWRPSFQLC